jgi:hypothetical protein
LDLIRHEVFVLLGRHVQAILLTGGFGRGEGSVVLSPDGVKIVNDYDIAIVLKASSHWQYLRLYRKFHRPLSALAEQLAGRLQMKQIDLVLRPPSYFNGRPPLKIENYEVRNGHQLLYGEEDPCRRMPKWRAEDLPLFEGTWLFRNRGLGLLMAACYLGRDGQIAEDCRDNFVIECNKAQMAMGDSVLLLNRRYHWSYAERLKVIQAAPLTGVPQGQELARHYLEALEHKLRPDFPRYYARPPGKWWHEIASLFNDFFRYFESKRLGVEFTDWLEYEKRPKPEDKLDLRIWLGGAVRSGVRLCQPSVWRLNLLKARKSKTIALMALLVFAEQDFARRTDYLKRAAALLNEQLTGDFDRDWSCLTGRFLLLMHPGGEAGRLANKILHPGR